MKPVTKALHITAFWRQFFCLHQRFNGTLGVFGKLIIVDPVDQGLVYFSPFVLSRQQTKP